MVESFEDLKKQFRDMMAEEKRMLEKATGVSITETIIDLQSEEEIVRRALGRLRRE